MSHYENGLVWFRRDLRSHDHAALHHALRACRRVWCVFVFDRDILDPLLERGLNTDRRVEFIHECVRELDAELRRHGSGLLVLHERAVSAIPRLAERMKIDAVFFNHDYEPDAQARDDAVTQVLRLAGRFVCSYKDQVIFEKEEVQTAAKRPFSVFTPYKNAWLRTLLPAHVAPYDTDGHLYALAPLPAQANASLPSLNALGFCAGSLAASGIPGGMSGASALLDDFLKRIEHYAADRDFPAIKAPSCLSVHLRFGTISIRALVRAALAYQANDNGRGASTWLSELIWRDFYFQILYHQPRVVDQPYKPEYAAIRWESGHHAESLFAAWCKGRTGYPLIDAAMAQINRTGYMHNRLRMVVASFLTKDLGLDWRWGERYFSDQLIDFDLAANNGGWQWAASTGCDAQPYFRIFNPITQSEKFDPEGRFIKRYLPQLQGLSPRQIHAPWRLSAEQQEAVGIKIGQSYPAPIVDHAIARAQTLARYARVKRKQAHSEQV